MTSTNEAETQSHIKVYFRHLWATLAQAPFTHGTWLYLAIVLVGVAGATWFIPTFNGNETSPETLGIYVLGILIAIFADALLIWKKSSDDVIAETVLFLSFLLSFAVAYFSAKADVVDLDGNHTRHWRPCAELVLYSVLALAVIMWAMLIVVEPPFNNQATQKPPSAANLSGGR